MTTNKQLGEMIVTQDGSVTIRDPEMNEEYHSQNGALEETYELYLYKSGFSNAVEEKKAVAVLDVGLGLGYNALAAIECWLSSQDAGPLTIISLEKQSHLVEAIALCSGPWCQHWPQGWPDLAKSLKKVQSDLWQGQHDHPNGALLTWQVIVGDAARITLPKLKFNFIFQDAFSPRKNPELWSSSWFGKIFSHAAHNCTLVSYSVARLVKDNLEASGWQYSKIPAPGKKKQWLIAKAITPE